MAERSRKKKPEAPPEVLVIAGIVVRVYHRQSPSQADHRTWYERRRPGSGRGWNHYLVHRKGIQVLESQVRPAMIPIEVRRTYGIRRPSADKIVHELGPDVMIEVRLKERWDEGFGVSHLEPPHVAREVGGSTKRITDSDIFDDGGMSMLDILD